MSLVSFEKIDSQLQEQRHKVDYNSYDMSVRELLRMLEEGEIEIAPTYQRQFVWEAPDESRLVESIFLEIPIPPLFMATNKDGTWEVVDGVQRLSTIAHFVGDEALLKKIDRSAPLKLVKLSKLSNMAGLVFKDFPKGVQQSFFLRPLRIVTLTDKSDTEVRFDLFERINTGGVRLTSQQIRNCVFRGNFNEFLERMADEPDFQHVVKLSENKRRRGKAQEYILRFFAFYYSLNSFKGSLDPFLNEFTRKANKGFDYQKGEALFRKIFSALRKALPEGIYRDQKHHTPGPLFEAVSVGLALAMKEKKNIDSNKLLTLMNSEELKGWTTSGTNSKEVSLKRIEYVRKGLLEEECSDQVS